MAGRAGSGERWEFASLFHELKASRAHTLEYLERFQIQKELTPPNRWAAADACYFGTTLVSGSDADQGAIERLHQQLNAIDGVRAAADVLDRRVTLVRVAATAGPAFHNARAKASAVSWAW